MAKARDEKRKAQLKAKFRAEKRQSRKTYQEQQEVAALAETIAAGAPASGSNPMALDQAVPGSYSGAKTFEEMPLSQYTKAALKDAGYVNLTAIQRAALPHALAGRDILGAAKTGSGKTLCFLVPVSCTAAACAMSALLDRMESIAWCMSTAAAAVAQQQQQQQQ